MIIFVNIFHPFQIFLFESFVFAFYPFYAVLDDEKNPVSSTDFWKDRKMVV